MKAKTADIISVIVGVALMAWLFASIQEVSANHMNTGFIYSAWNFFKLF
jgi:hypothetical protein